MCAFDALSTVAFFVHYSVGLQSPRAALRKIAGSRLCDVEDSRGESSLLQLQKNTVFRLAVFVLGTLPQAIKLYGMSGIVWTKIWGVMFLSSFATLELLVLLPRDRWEPSVVNVNSTSSKDWTIWVGIGALCSSLTLAFYFFTMAVFDIVITTSNQSRWPYLLGYAILATAYLASVLLSYLGTRNNQIYLVSVASVIMIPLSFFGSFTTGLYLPVAFASGLLPSAVLDSVFVGISVVSALALTLYTFYRLINQVRHDQTEYIDFVVGTYFLLLHVLAALLYYKFKFDPQGTIKPIWTDQLG